MRVSVVIASHNAAKVMAHCLSALNEQHSWLEEIIVADSSTDGTEAIVRERFPAVKVAHYPQPLTLPQLRAKGIAMACGDVIAILDPYSIVDRQWAEQLIQQHQARANQVIGGTVDLYEPEKQNLLTWAQYINEYGMFMTPMPEGAIEILPGSNISYKRAALVRDGTSRYDEFWKTFVNETIQANSGLWIAPQVMVYLNKPIPFPDFLRTRFDHGRCYAGMRIARASRVERVLRAISAPLVPFILLWRWGKRFWPKKRYRGRYLLTLPLQFILFGNWALGEFVGYTCGAGESCGKLFY